MFITYQELLGMKEMEDAKVVAGKEGMNKTIRWCHVIEIKTPGKWATQNLLVFATGVALVDDVENGLLEMVRSLANQNASGLVLGIGPYIPEVPDSVKREADETKLPIIALPQEIKFVDVSFQIANLIFEKTATNNRQHLLLENVLTDSGESNYDAELEYYGYLRNTEYRLVVIHKNSKGKIATAVEEALQILTAEIRSRIQKKIFLLNRMNQFILFIPQINGSSKEYEFEDILKDLDCLMEKQIGEGGYQISVSEWVNQSSMLRECYRQTKEVYEKGRWLFPEKRIVYYSELGIFSMVDLNKKNELENIMQNELGELVKYNELIITLQAYIDHNMNMQETADALYVHINTMKYRLKKIDCMLPEGLKKNQIFRIQTGLYLYRILKFS